MIMWRLIGLALKVYGRAFKRCHMLWLGYYLLGSGKRRALPDWAWDGVTGMHRGLYRDTPSTRGWFTPSGMEGSMDMFNTVGKFIRRDDRLLDRYAFYPTCNKATTHGMTCDCDTERDWSDINVSIKLREVGLFARWTWATRKVTIGPVVARTYLSGRALRFEIETSDRTFADVGRPFYTTGQIPSRLL